MLPLSSILSCSSPSLMLANALVPTGSMVRATDLPYGDRERQLLDVYTPAISDASAPVVVFLHGGRWSYGSKDDYPFVAQALTARGFVCVVVGYRLYPEVRFPGFVEDAAAAVAWVVANIGRYGGDPDNVFMLGHSAGAHIAALLALDASYLGARSIGPGVFSGVIGISGPYDFLPLDGDDLRDMFGPPERYPDSQPVNFANPSVPPMLLLHGREDRTVGARNSKRLATRLREHGADVRTVYYHGLGHIETIAAFAPPLRRRRPVLDDVVTFVRDRSRDRARSAA